MALGDRIVVMSKGSIAQVGTPREIYHHPVNTFVADFVGTVNRLPSAYLRNGDAPPGPEVMFRPEDADIVSAIDSHFTGEVRSAFFLGDRTRLILDCGGESSVMIESVLRETAEIGSKISIRIRSGGFMELKADTDDDLE